MLLSWLTDLGSMCKLRLLRSSFNSWIIFFQQWSSVRPSCLCALSLSWVAMFQTLQNPLRFTDPGVFWLQTSLSQYSETFFPCVNSRVQDLQQRRCPQKTPRSRVAEVVLIRFPEPAAGGSSSSSTPNSPWMSKLLIISPKLTTAAVSAVSPVTTSWLTVAAGGFCVKRDIMDYLSQTAEHETPGRPVCALAAHSVHVTQVTFLLSL